MDYDDNDFQSQNLQLAGEGSNKFPPTLQPYALSKFDFDDTLHGSLRFDGLVETEVFLGIESNEDNHWIEDFSRGNSGIQFNSSAAESCSISRHNNVWSEATSSESVEMLLKSVGQEEIVPVQTSNKELDACDELGCIIKKMEPSLKYDNGTPSSVGDMSGLHPILPPDEGIDNVCVASDVGGQYPQVDDNSQTREDNLSGERDLNDQTSISADDCIAVTEGSLVPDDGGNEVSEKENTMVTVSLDEMKEKASTSGIQAGCLLESSENTIGGSDELKKENHPNFRNRSDEDSVNVPDAYCEHREEQHQLMQQFHGGNPVVDTNMFRSSSPHLDTTNLSNMEEPPSIESKQDSGLSEKLDIVDQFRVAKHEVEPRSDVIIEKHEVNELDHSSSHNKKIVDNNAVTLLCKEESEPSKGKIDCSNSGHGDGSSNVGLQSSATEFLGEKHGESHTSSATMTESKGICMRGIMLEQSGTPVCDENLPAEGKESTELPSDNSTMEAVVDQSLVIDKRVGAMCFGGGLENKLIDSKLPSDSAGIKTDNVGGSIGPAEHAIASNTPIDQGDVEKSALPLVGCIYTGKNEDDMTMASVEASTSDSKTSMRLQTGSDPAAESERITYSGASGPMLGESRDQSLLTFDACKTESHGEPQAVVRNKGSQKNAEEIDVCPVLCDSTEKNGDAELVVKAVDAKESYDTEPAVGNSDVLGAVASSMGGSAHGAGQKDQQENELMTSSTVINYGLSAVPVTSESGGSSNQVEQVSISSTVNGSAELPHNEIIKDGVKGIPSPTVLASEITDVDISKGSSASGDAKQNDVPVDERSFTFEVSPPADTPQKEEMAKWHPISSTITNRMIVDGTPSTSDLGQSSPKAPQEVSQGSQKTSAVAPHSSSKSKTDRKTRRSSGKATAKGTPKRGTGKESTPVRLDRGDKLANVSLSPSGISQLVQPNEMQRYGHVDSSTLKPFVLAASTTSLPDLNSSVSASAMFQQPFTDLQQVQLRAQIFVYGALIQGIAPDEAYMISAFGGADGGRSIWENAWRSFIERLHGQKPHFATPETPLQSRTGARGPDQSIKQSAPGNKALSTSIGQVSTKGTTTANPTVPLSSPLWSFPTPSSGMPRGPVINYQRALSPLHPHQSPSIRSFAGNPSWISQAPFCGSWVSSPQTAALDASGHFSMQFPISETIQLTPSKDSSMPHSSGVKHVFPFPVVQTEASPGVFAGASAPDLRKMTSSSDRPSTEPKTRKRKKTSVSETPGHNILNPLSQEEAVSVSAVASHVSTSVAVTSPLNFVSKAPPEKIVTSVPVATTDLGRMDQNIAGSAVSYEETLFKVKEARVQAEDAAAFAAAAVSHSQGIWNQLEKQRKTGMSPDIETKLMSAAAAIDAAAAVAKAAAAAANVASNAALQAKLMADETVTSTSYRNDDQSYAVSLSGGVNNMGKATPASILSADDGANNSSSILVAAREAARRRVEAASAASKQAENMDAIVKAAELAAEAVAQAGKIVAMGDTFSMEEAVASGSEGYLKVAQVTSGRGSKFVDVSRENRKIDKSGEGPDTSSRRIEETNYLRPPTSIGTCEDDMRLVDVISSSGASVAKDARTQKGRKASDLSKTIGVVPESENGSRSSQNEFEKTEEMLKGNSIKKGSHVEVFKGGNGFKSAWFTANVLSLKDGMAHVSYDELRTAEGAEKLEEWVPLFDEGRTSPKIRIARRVTAMPFEGTRKRRRAAVVDDPWSVGDRVDAWIQDSWWEGIITEKSIKDETLFTVHFPVQNETSVVRAWHLRSSLIWKDGQWIEWSSLRETGHPTHVGDTPQEKRQRVRSPVAEAKGKDKMPKIVDSQESDKPNEPRLLDISADERLFNIGKITRDNNKPDTLRMTRTGLQKEGSRVVFGVPKPGKKRKFMEVSKHYVSDGSGKVNEPNYSAKFTRPMRPQQPGSRGWKNTSKVEANEKQAAIPKPKVLKSGKPQYASARTISSRKDNLLSAQVSSTAECPSADHIAKTTDSSSHTENTSEKHNLVDLQSFSGSEGDEGPVLFSSLSLPSKKISSNAKPERVSKGKLAPAGGKLGKIEEDKVFSSNTSKSAIDVIEPRRSNRRIQPTSRLLEGLQSSLMVSKIPSAPHDKSQKSRIGSRGNKHD